MPLPPQGGHDRTLTFYTHFISRFLESRGSHLRRLYIGLNTKDHRLRRVYRTRNSLKVFCFVFLAFALFFAFSRWRGISVGASTWLDLVIAIVLVLAGAGFAAQTFTGRVVLSDDSIRHGSVFRSQSMRLDQIRYRREYEEYQDSPEGGINVYYLELVPYDGEGQSLKISKDDFDFDRAFWEWVVRIPDFEHLKPSAPPAYPR
jgi:hypothetical protein